MASLDTAWVEELREQSKADLVYAPLAKEIAQLEPTLRATLDSLPPEQASVIHSYLRLLQKSEVCFTRMAYQLGKEHANKARK